MRVEAEQNNQIREHLKRMSEHHMHQKSAFKKLFDSGIEIDYKSPQITKLMCEGVPSLYRARVWPALLENVHGITPKFYELLIKKAALYIESQPTAVIPQRARTITQLNRIESDIERTYPELKIFKKDNQQGQCLFNILSAWTVYREDVGYIQGMSQIVGLLLMELKEIDAFTAFCAIMTNDIIFLYENMSIDDIQFFQHKFEKRLRKGDEAFYSRLKDLGVETRTYLLTWILTLFTRTMSLDMVSNLWDIFFVHSLCEDILIETSFELTQALKSKLSADAMSEQVHALIRNFKLSDIEAFQVISKIRQIYRCQLAQIRDAQ